MNDLSMTFSEMDFFDSSYAVDDIMFIASHGDKSVKISLEDIAMQLANEALLSIESAARSPSSKYALSSHDHDIYTSAMFEPRISYDDLPEDGSISISTIMTMHDQTHSQSYDMNVVVSKEIGDIDDLLLEAIQSSIISNLPHVGSVKMMAMHDANAVMQYNASSPDFMGWVPANGASYNASYFILSDDICKTYQVDSNGRFSVPKLNNFCMIDCNTSHVLSITLGNTCMPNHKHQIETSNSTINALINENDIKGNSFKNIKNTTVYDEGTVLPSNFTKKKPTQDEVNFKIHAGKMKNSDKNEDHYKMSIACESSIDPALFRNSNIQTAAAPNDSEKYWSEGKRNQAIAEGNTNPDFDSWPVHDLVPAFVYIGPSIYSKSFLSMVKDAIGLK